MMSTKTSPFTAIQLQELEQQALIFKYMLSGSHVPPYLISTVKRSLESSRLFPHQPTGWGSFQMGFGRKPDPEPGRCRRTDGKKWRCSKEAHPDSKYCERHMHRGRNRSRKPVEITAPTPIPPTPTATSISISPLSSLHDNIFLYPSSSSSRLDSDYSYIHGVRHEMGLRESSVTPATSPAGYLQFQSLTDESREKQEKGHCFVLGKDFKSSASTSKEEVKQRPFHHFFGECSSSLEGEEISLSRKPNFSTTHLSISMPPSTRG